MGEEKGEPMKRPLTIVAMLAALAVPALVSAQQANPPVSSPGAATARAERGWVDPARLAHLLEAKGLITSQEEKALTHPRGAPAVDDQTWRVCASTAAKGSSIRRIWGSMTRAPATSSRCCIPPDSSWG